jgi:cell division protease FtsH
MLFDVPTRHRRMGGDGDEPPRKRRLPPDDEKGRKQPPFMTPRPLKTLAFWLMMTVLVLVAVNVYHLSRPEERKISYSSLHQEVEKGNIKDITISGREAAGEFVKEVPITTGARTENVKRFITQIPMEPGDTFISEIQTKNPNAEVDGAKEKPNWFGVMLTYLPIILIIGFWLFFIRQMQSGGSAALKFGKSKAKLLVENKPRVTFRDVAGADEAKEELQEIIEFLRDPKKFQTLGGRIPKGALLLGPPGTGKTLLAKAVAGEAAVPFFSMSGSDFVEMFVGVGASRVRDLFDQGKRSAPCIIFIDEIDAVGRHRGAGLGGGHDEREQTLNQLLVEMDGFESNEGVILIAATNRPDVLDPALLRPGRFDRQIVVDSPDVKGREAILRIHTRKIPLAEDVDLTVIARGTPGMVGADLANMVNEAALLGARRNHRRVTHLDFEDAKDKVMMGAERKSRIISDEEKKVTAYHEAGHTLVGKLTPNADPIHKVTIVPRGRALGVTHFLPIDERHTYSKEYCEGVLARMMGGRAAEEVTFGEITTGAGNDIQQATTLARKMVCEWGMSAELGPLTFGRKEEMIFLGKEIAHERDYSEATAQKIDREVRSLVETSHQKALQIIKNNEDKLHALAQALLEREILDATEIDKLIAGESLEPEVSPTDPDTGTPAQEETKAAREEPEKKGRLQPPPEPHPGPA